MNFSPKLQWTESSASEGKDQAALGHAHRVEVVIVATPGEEDEAGVVAGTEGEPDAGVAANRVGVNLEEPAAVKAHCLDCLEERGITWNS